MSDFDYRPYPILVVDDEPDILESFHLTYGEDFTIHCAGGGAVGLEFLRSHDVAVVVVDQRMPGMSGLEFLERTMALKPDLVRIILTGYTDIDLLVEAINKSRIYRYVTKPWDPTELGITLRRAIEAFHLTRENARLLEELRIANEQLRLANERLASENVYLKERESRDYATSGIVGNTRPMRDVLGLVQKVAPSGATVLILGETGTGKELVARAVHELSPRLGKLFVALNCAALAESLLESELFGHRRGAFTGAVGDKKGLFEVAHGGTLFLDEIAETTPGLQARLLRALQEGEIMPIGDTRQRKVDVRVIAATNRNLEEEVKQGRFRSDLYYRLRVFPIRVPPLRDRREDIPDLVRHFVAKHATKLGKHVSGVEAEAMELLASYSYPGNVRELENEIERAVLLAEPGDEITTALLSEVFTSEPTSGGSEGEQGVQLRERRRTFERNEIQAALDRNQGKKVRAAKELGISQQGLFKKMRQLGML